MKENWNFIWKVIMDYLRGEHFEEEGEPVIQEYSKRKGKENAEKITVREVFPDMIFWRRVISR